MLSKSELRKEYLTKRNEINKVSANIVLERLRKNKEFKNAKTIFCYVSTGSEPDTSLLLEEILKTGKNLLVPKCINKKGHMIAVKIESLAELQESTFGIKEPVSCKETEKSEIDLCIVPGLSFDKDGFRLGYGGGYYDRFLSGLNIYSIGVCIEELYSEKLPREENDIFVNEVVYI